MTNAILPQPSLMPPAVPAMPWDHSAKFIPPAATAISEAGTSAVSLLELVERIYRAAEEPARWEQVLQQVALTLHADTVVLVAPSGAHPLMFAAGRNAGRWMAYVRKGAAGPSPRSGRELLLGEAEPVEVCASGVEEILVRCNIGEPDEMHHALGVVVPLEGSWKPYLLVLRQRREGSFDGDEQRKCAALLPHLVQALRLHMQCSGMRAELQAAQAALDAFGHAVIRLDSRGRAVIVNASARRAMAAEKLLAVDEGMLHTADPEQNRALQDVLQKAVAEDGFRGRSLLLKGDGKQHMQATVLPVLGETASDRGAVVLLTRPGQPCESRMETLRALYQLSPSECRIAGLLAHGFTIREMAQQTHLTLETIRFHVKRLLSKTGTRRQAELMKLIFVLPCL